MREGWDGVGDGAETGLGLSGWISERELRVRCCFRSPIVQQIRQDCAEPFAAFEQCLKENQASVMNCSDHVNAFLLCADQVKLST